MPRLPVLLLLLLVTGALSSVRPVERPALADQAARLLAVEAVPVTLTAPADFKLRLVSSHILRSGEPRFGGLSGVVVKDEGRTLVAISDRGDLFWLGLRRAGGRIAGVETARTAPLIGSRGRALTSASRDAEGLAVFGDGLAVSFEGEHRVMRYSPDGSSAVAMPDPPGLDRLSLNSGMEGLASDAAGALFALPERSGALDRPFPMWRLRPGDGSWEVGAWPRRPPFLVTGADVGPDGNLYVLERDFSFFRGWSVRLSRAPLAAWPTLQPETLLEWQRGGIDNMEAVSVWRDQDGTTRIVLLSDDNFHPLQRTLLLEFVLE